MIRYTELKEHRHNLRDVIPLDKPYSLLVEPSNFCNFKCIQCFQSLKKDNYISQNRGMMSLEMFNEIMEQVKGWKGGKLKVLKLSLYGEPLLNKDFCKMLKAAREADIAERIETTTNASLLTEETARLLVEYEIDYVRVSIYGANQERFEYVTGCRQIGLQQVYDNLKRLKDIKESCGREKPFVSAKMLETYTDEDREFMERFAAVADEVFIDKPHNWIATEEKNFIGSFYSQGQKEALDRDLSKTLSDRIACTMPFTTMSVRSNGDVSPCCVDWCGGTNIGNVLESTLEELWNGNAMYEFRKMQLENRKSENESCRNCEFYKNDHYIKDSIDGFPVERLRRQAENNDKNI